MASRRRFVPFVIYSNSKELIISSIGSQARTIGEHASKQIDLATFSAVLNQVRQEPASEANQQRVIGMPEYEEIRQLLTSYKEANNLKYLYTMAKMEDGQYMDIVDAYEPSEIEDASLPGTVEQNTYDDLVCVSWKKGTEATKRERREGAGDMRLNAAKPRYRNMLVALTICSMSWQAWAASVHAYGETTTTSRTNIAKSETGEYIVKLRDKAPRKTTMLRAASGGVALAESSGEHMLIRLKESADESVLQTLADDPNVEYIEPNIRMHAAATIDDPYFSQQWGLAEVQAPQAWEETEGGSNVTVAVIDTGVDSTHPDLTGRVDTANDYDYVHQDRDARDDQGHGTHVAGIIAARLDSQGIAGVTGNSKVKILPLKVLDENGEGDLYDVSTAIMDAADLGADVINLSLGGELEEGQTEAPRTMTDAIRYALDKGALVVAAAGNEASDADRFVPASIPGVVTVSAVDEDLHLADFSNYGSSVDLAAPGVDILSTYPGGRYAYGSGTSQATPFVSGIAALLKASDPDLTVTELTDRLLATAKDLGMKGRDSQYGYGLVNAYRAMQPDSSDETLDDSPAAGIRSLKADQSKLSLPPDGSGTITLTAYLTNGSRTKVSADNVVWKSKDQKVAVVDHGVVTAKGFGKTTITAAYGGKTVSVPVDITVTKLSASRTSLAMKPDEAAEVELKVTYGDKSRQTLAASSAEWKTGNAKVAVYRDGQIVATGFGSTTLTATYRGKSVRISVDTRLKQLKADATRKTLQIGEAFAPAILATYSDGSSGQVEEGITWTSYNEKIASVEKNGEITAKAKGSTTITAKYGGKTVRISITVTP